MEKGADDSESEPDHDRIAEAQKGAAEAASFSDVFFVKFCNDIKSTVIFLDVFDDSFSGFKPFMGFVAAGHGYGRFYDIAVVDAFPLNHLNGVADVYKPLAFHFKFHLTHAYHSFVCRLKAAASKGYYSEKAMECKAVLC